MDVFNITTGVFLKKICKTFIVCKDDFLEMTDIADDDRVAPRPDIYGPIWLITTYALLLALAANLNTYYAFGGHPTSFHFKSDFLSHSVVINVLFRLA